MRRLLKSYCKLKYTPYQIKWNHFSAHHLSSSTLTADEIATSITEALRLIPGLIVTWQKTEIEDMPTGFNTEAVDPVNNINNTVTVNNDQTPSLFGGIYLNYKPVKHLNVNLNSYYMSSQNQYSFYSLMNPATTSG